MTLLDAPVFDEGRDRRRQLMLYSGVGSVFLLVIVFWLVSGMPFDWPWEWYSHLAGKSAANHFLAAVEKNDLQKAYSIWLHDPDWQKHPEKYGSYPFTRFERDWSSTSPDNEYGVIQTHKIVAARVYHNVLLMGILINGRKSKALFLTYFPKDKTLNFAPPDEELYLGP
jgi:hypothetical protein